MEFRDIVENDADEMEPVGGEATLLVARATAQYVAELSGLGPLETQVVALAREDGLSSIEEPSRIEKLVSALFGLRSRGRQLADLRLESLRRAVVIARHRHHLPDPQAAELRGWGFSLGQVRAIEAFATAA